MAKKIRAVRETMRKNPDAYWGRRLIVFILLVCLLVLYLFHVFGLNDNRHSEQTFRAYYALEKDTIDVLYTGSSGTYRYFSPYQAWAESGITSFDLTSGSQPIVLQKNIIREALKTQHPKVILIELRNIVKTPDLLNESAIRRVTDAMRFSSNRNAAIREALKYFRHSKSYDPDNFNLLSYYIPFLKYHGRWNDDIHLSDWKLSSPKNHYMGQVLDSALAKVATGVHFETTDAVGTLSRYQKETLEDLLQYCDSLTKSGKTHVVFVSTPYATTEEGLAVINAAERMVEKRGYTCLNFNRTDSDLAEKMHLNTHTDFCGDHHANIIGMTKYTRYMTGYLVSHYHLKDHRQDRRSVYRTTWSKGADAFYTKIEDWAKEAGYDAMSKLESQGATQAEIEDMDDLIQSILKHVPKS